jgi:hypothetical protein
VTNENALAAIQPMDRRSARTRGPHQSGHRRAQEYFLSRELRRIEDESAGSFVVPPVSRLLLRDRVAIEAGRVGTE